MTQAKAARACLSHGSTKMKTNDAVRCLAEWATRGKVIHTIEDLRVLFHKDRPQAFHEGLRRLVASGLLLRVSKGVYAYPFSTLDRQELLYQTALTLRRGSVTYISLESSLSGYGLISQVPIDHLTLMTTGRKGVFETPWGSIEFTHTERALADILEGTIKDGPLRLACPEIALQDLRRVGRNLHLVQQDEVYDVLLEKERAT